MSITYSYDHEENWGNICSTVLGAGGTGVPTANIQVAQSMTVSRSPRIEVEVEGDERASEQMARWPSETEAYSQLGTYTSTNQNLSPTNAQNGFRFYVSPQTQSRTVYVGGVTLPNWYGFIQKNDSTEYVVYVNSGTESVPLSTIFTVVTYGDFVTYFKNEATGDLPFGEWYYSHRAANIVTRIVTNRTSEFAQNHGNIRSRVRYLFSREAQAFVSPVVTIYQTLDVQENGSNVFVRDPDGDREDVTEFRHRIEYGIMPATVPTI